MTRLITYREMLCSNSDEAADHAGRYARLRRFCAWRHGELPGLPWRSSLSAAGRGSVLAADHWRTELVRLPTGFDVAEACAPTSVVPSS
jgi:hypothetical protein